MKAYASPCACSSISKCMQQHFTMQAAAHAQGMLRATAQNRRFVARCGRLLNKRLQRVELHCDGVYEDTRCSLYERQLRICQCLCAVQTRIVST